MSGPLWILYHVYRDTAASRVAVDVMPNASLPFYRTLLEREQRFHRHLPTWFLPPVILSTTAIAVTFYTSARFAHTAVFFAVMAWIIIGAALSRRFAPIAGHVSNCAFGPGRYLSTSPTIRRSCAAGFAPTVPEGRRSSTDATAKSSDAHDS